MTIIVNHRVYRIDFRHARNLKHVRAVTMCAITVFAEPGYHAPEGIEVTALGSAICFAGDNFARRTGRLKALNNALDHCGVLRGVRVALAAGYLALDPDPVPRVRAKLDAAAKTARWEAGWETRQRRALQSTARAAVNQGNGGAS